MTGRLWQHGVDLISLYAVSMQPHNLSKRHRINNLAALVLRTSALSLLLLAGFGLTAPAADLSHMQPPPEQPGESVLVNRFILNSDSASPTASVSCDTADSTVIARLLTPLNSATCRQGDAVTAVISEPIKGPLGAALPVGTLLHGDIDRSIPNGRMRRDGQILFRFYTAETGGRTMDLSLRIANSDGVMHPLKYRTKPTGKQYLRTILMMSSHFAIPMAIGSGGISLAITTGAGAIIGGVLADNHKYFQGAVRGAWEASGLAVFDPLVQKGKQVVIPWGTRLTLQLMEPVSLPRADPATIVGQYYGLADLYCKGPFRSAIDSRNPSGSLLSTSARLINRPRANRAAARGDGKADATSDPLKEVKLFLDQKNLAAAMQALDQVQAQYPNDPRVKAEKDELMPLVTGIRPHQ